MKHFYKILILFLSISISSFSTNYYFSSTGLDSNNGTSVVRAWKSLNKLEDVVLIPGDSILLKSGEIFIGQIQIRQSGSAQYPIVISSYGDKTLKQPYLTGATSIQKWDVYPQKTNMFFAILTMPVKQLYLGDKFLYCARYPNFPQTLTAGSGLNRNLIKQSGTNTLTQPKDYWKGATVRYKSWPWLFEYGQIASSDPNGGLTVSSVNGPRNGAHAGNPWYLENIKGQLDAPNEWFYDNTTNELIYYPATASTFQTSNMKAVIYDNGIMLDASVNYVNISNLIVDKYAENGFIAQGQNNYVKLYNCIFQNIEKSGVKFWRKSKNNTVNKCYIKNCRGRGISFTECSYNVISNNVVRRIGLVAGHGISATNGASGILIEIKDETGNNDWYNEVAKFNVVHHNIVDSCGYVGIRVDGENNLVEKNYLNRSMITLDDGGGLYCYSSLTRNSKFKNNFVYRNSSNSGVNQGIYVDNSVHDVIVANNTVAYHPGTGILINAENYNDSVLNNVIFDNNYGLMFPDWGTNPIRNNQIIGNKIVTFKPDGSCVDINSNSGRYNVGFFDYNYYVHPYGQKIVSYGWNPVKIFNFASWRSSNPTMDSHSVALTNFATYPTRNVFLFTNISESVRQIDLTGFTYTDLDKKPIGILLLQPYTSKVLLKTDLTKGAGVVPDPPIVLPVFNLPAVNYDLGSFDDGTLVNPNSLKYEAENAIAIGGGINNNHPGFSGSGFWDNVGAVGNYIEFTVKSESNQTVEILTRFSSGDSNKTLTLYVNGIKNGTLTFLSTNGWDSWANRTDKVLLKTGDNLIKYQYDAGNTGYINLDYIQLNLSTDFPSLKANNNLFVYPNPATDKLTIKNLIVNSYLSIWSIEGKIVYQQSVNNSGSLKIDVSKFNKGVYFVKATDSFTTRTEKIIIE